MIGRPSFWTIVVVAVCGANLWAAAARSEERQAVLIVVGATGAEEFEKPFREWTARWETVATKGNATVHTIGLTPAGEMSDREALKTHLDQLASNGPNSRPVWIVLIGHGTFDGKTARFNLRGPDLAPSDLAEWLKPLPRPAAIIACASSSSPFLTELSGPGRVIVSATRSAHEYNWSRLGGYLAKAIDDPSADLDKDEQVSLLEAYLRAAADVREFYATENRLATEHAMLDDNGDKLGTPADWYRGIRAVKSAKSGASLDGERANQFHLVRSAREEKLPEAIRLRRDEFERELAALRPKRATLSEDEYLKLVEPIMVELAKLYLEPPTAVRP